MHGMKLAIETEKIPAGKTPAYLHNCIETLGKQTAPAPPFAAVAHKKDSALVKESAKRKRP